MQRYLTIFLLIVFFLNFPFLAEAEKILIEGDIRLLSCSKINDSFFVLYSKYGENFGEIFLKEFDLDWNEIRDKRLDINGASVYLAYFNNRFYVSYTSFEKEGNVHLAEFDLNFNLIRDILVTPTPYDGEVTYQLIPMDDNHLYLFYARNWVRDCGLKMVRFNRYLEPLEEISLMQGNVDFHVHQASEFSVTFANGHLYIAYKGYVSLKEILDKEIEKSREDITRLKAEIQQINEEIENLEIVRGVLLKGVEPDTRKIEILDEEIKKKISQLEDLNQELKQIEKEIEDKRKVKDVPVASVFINEYSLEGNLIRQRNIGAKESLSPSLFFKDKKFYLAYEEYDDKLMRPIIHIHQYDSNWGLIKKTRIITGEKGMPRPKAIIVSEGRCYLISMLESKNKIFLKEIDFDLEEEKVGL